MCGGIVSEILNSPMQTARTDRDSGCESQIVFNVWLVDDPRSDSFQNKSCHQAKDTNHNRARFLSRCRSFEMTMRKVSE